MTDVPAAPKSTTYRVTGMTCGGCAKSLAQAIERAHPGMEFEISVENATLTVVGPSIASEMQEVVESAGFDFGGAA